jgi:hypothetical protein
MPSEASAPDPTLKDARRDLEAEGHRALCDHAAECAARARERYGVIDAEVLPGLLQDPLVTRRPAEVRFETALLKPGEPAYVEPRGDNPDDGFVIWVHPHFQDRPEALPLLVAYQLVRVNYGEVATHAEAEAFGAALLGLDRDEYYTRMCALADELPAS